MTQIVTIVKFFGESANYLLKKLSGPDRKNFAGRLAAAMTNKEFALRPPVIYYAQYLDQWSMADVFQGILPRHITTNNQNNAVLAWCKLPRDMAWFTTEFKKYPRRGTDEQWLYSTVLKAARYWETMPHPSIVLVSRHVIAGTHLDSEILESAGVLPDHNLFQ